MAHKRNSVEVPELEKLLAGKKKKYVRYEEGAVLYSMGKNSFRQVAQDAHAVVRLKRIALVNVEVLDEYSHFSITRIILVTSYSMADRCVRLADRIFISMSVTSLSLPIYSMIPFETIFVFWKVFQMDNFDMRLIPLG